MKDILDKKVFDVINSNIALARAIIVILFFENFSIYINKTSLFNTTLSLTELELKPLLFFFVFLAGMKLLWIFWHITRDLIPFFRNMDGKIKGSSSFAGFLLCFLGCAYFNALIDFPQLHPINPDTHPFFNRIFISPFALLAMGGLVINLLIGVNTDNLEV